MHRAVHVQHTNASVKRVVDVFADRRSSARVSRAAARARACVHMVSVRGLYDKFFGLGLEYGPMFRGLRSVWAERSDS